MKSEKLGMLLLASAFAACGDNDVPKTSGLLGVFPTHGFTGRTEHLEIVGNDGTDWKDGAAVSFGDGVTVSSVEVASPSDLYADITVDPAATVGKRDVTVTSGGTAMLEQAFELVPPVELQTQGSLGQGGLPRFKLVNHDPATPFDLTVDPITGEYANLVLSGPEKVGLAIDSVTADEITGKAFIDLDATASDLTVISGAGTAAVTSNCGTFGVLPRTPMPITGPTIGVIGVGDSQLYSIVAPGTPSLVHIHVKSNAVFLDAGMFTSNHWPVVGPHQIFPGPATVTFVVGDAIDDFGAQYTVAPAGEMLTNAPEGDDTTNGATAGALAASILPFEQTGGTLSSASDVDVISFPITAANANRRVTVITDVGNDPYTDTAVDITDAAGTTSYLSIYGGGRVDRDWGEEVLSDQLQPGTYYLKISAGSMYATTHQAYTAVIWIEE